MGKGLALAAILLLCPYAVPAAIPSTLSYQGVLRDGSGTPVIDSDYTVMFQLYDVETGGTELWSEEQVLSVAEGIVNASLGSVTPFGTLEFDVPYWLGISVDGEAELTPRTPLTSVPYALRALHADAAADEDWSISGSDIFRLTGRVGIGTEMPETKLHVVGDVKVDGRLAVAEITSGLPMSGKAQDEETVTTAASSGRGKRAARGAIGLQEAEPIWPTKRDNDLSLQTDGTTRLHIDGSTGNVGVGTETPGARLDVAGSVRAEGLTVTTTPSDMFVLTSDASGNATWQPSSGERVPNIVYADRMTGLTAGEKILAAITELTSGNAGTGQDGIVDARGIPSGEIDVNLIENINCAVTLLLGAGEYAIHTPQVLRHGSSIEARKAKLYLRGQGMGTILMPSVGMTVFEVSGEEMHFTDLVLDMGGNNCRAIYIRGVTWNGVLIERVRFKGGAGNSPYIRVGEAWDHKGSPGPVLRDLWMWGSLTQVGIELHTEQAVIDHCSLSSLGTAITLDFGTSTTISNSTFGHCHHSLVVEGDYDSILFVGNDCEAGYASEGHIRIVGDAAWFPVRNLVVRDNYFTQLNSPEMDAIYLKNVDGVVVQGNRFASGFVGSGARSVVFDTGVSNVTILGNIALSMEPWMQGHDLVPLQLDDVTACQSSMNAGFSGTLDVGGAISTRDFLRIEPRDYPPSDPGEGDMYMDSSTHKLMVHDGTTWRACW